MECLQKTGAFKIRGASNILSKLHEQNMLPSKVIANSSGNHAQGVAYAANLFNLPSTIYCSDTISSIKASATQFYGAHLYKFPNRKQADLEVQEKSKEDGTLWIPPFNHPDIIAGQGTAAYEALQEVPNIDAIVAPCGGGGLLSGTLVSARAHNTQIEVIGVEPLLGNDAAISLRTGDIHTLEESPNTLADGAATLAVGDITFNYLKELDNFYEANETNIAYWTQWLQHLLKVHIEPTSAMAMHGASQWLKNKKTQQSVMIILSGGNIDQEKMQKVWSENHLEQLPSLN
jgi:threonine dehydratase